MALSFSQEYTTGAWWVEKLNLCNEWIYVQLSYFSASAAVLLCEYTDAVA